MRFFYNEHSLISGIYKIINTHTNRIYIGQAKEFKERWKKHRGSLLNNKHQNRFLQADFNKSREELGHDDFLEFHVLEVMENSTKEERNKREEEWIAKHWDKQNLCYNLTKYSCQPHYEDKWKRLAVNEKIRQKLLGRAMPEEVKRKISESNKGKHFGSLTPETRKKLSLSLKGKKPWNLGRKATSEEIERARTAHFMHCASNPKWVQKQAESHRGHKHSNETKDRMRNSARKIAITGVNQKTGEHVCFSSIKSASLALDIRNSNIHQVLKGLRKQVKGWVFQYIKP